MNEHYIKINKCIDSSNTTAHFECCERLISNFENLFDAKKVQDSQYTKKLVKNMVHNLTSTKSKLLEYL
jgi:hypothetical protein